MKIGILITCFILCFSYVFAEVQIAENKISCNQCLDTEFLDYRRFYQNRSSNRVIGYRPFLLKYPCLSGKFGTTLCSHSCLSIHLFHRAEKKLIGAMFDCSSQVLESNPSAHNGTNYKEFNESQVFVDDKIPGADIFMVFAFDNKKTMPASIYQTNHLSLVVVVVFGISIILVCVTKTFFSRFIQKHQYLVSECPHNLSYVKYNKPGDDEESVIVNIENI